MHEERDPDCLGCLLARRAGTDSPLRMGGDASVAAMDDADRHRDEFLCLGLENAGRERRSAQGGEARVDLRDRLTKRPVLRVEIIEDRLMARMAGHGLSIYPWGY